MSQNDTIRNIVQTTLADGKIHSIAELRAIVEQHSIKLSPKSTAVRTCVYNEREKKPNIVCVSRGVYQLIRDSSEPTVSISPYTLLFKHLMRN